MNILFITSSINLPCCYTSLYIVYLCVCQCSNEILHLGARCCFYEPPCMFESDLVALVSISTSYSLSALWFFFLRLTCAFPFLCCPDNKTDKNVREDTCRHRNVIQTNMFLTFHCGACLLGISLPRPFLCLCSQEWPIALANRVLFMSFDSIVCSVLFLS